MRRLFIVYCILLGGRSVAGESSAQERAPIAPFSVHWNVRDDSGGRLRLVAVVERRAVLHAPIDVTVEVPEGVRLRSGEVTFRIAAESEPGNTELPLEFTYTKVPATDLKVIARMRANGMGVQATDHYRFNRPAPQRPTPRPVAASRKVGDIELGPTIQLDPSSVEQAPAGTRVQPKVRRQ